MKTRPVTSITSTVFFPSWAAVSARRLSIASTLSNGIHDDVRERGGGLAELPPAADIRLHERGAAPVDERDHRDPVGDRVAVRLVEALEPAAVAPLLTRPLDQDVERRIGEPALVRAARRLEEQAKEVLGIGIAG